MTLQECGLVVVTLWVEEEGRREEGLLRATPRKILGKILTSSCSVNGDGDSSKHNGLIHKL